MSVLGDVSAGVVSMVSGMSGVMETSPVDGRLSVRMDGDPEKQAAL